MKESIENTFNLLFYKGILYYWANREDKTWNLSRVELELKSQPDRRMIIKKPEATNNSAS